MRLGVLVALCFLAVPAANAQTALTITTEPNAIVWIDDIRRGNTDASGKLILNKVSAGRHSVRVRANGFRETVIPLLPGRRALAVKLVTARDDSSLQKAADLYREAIKQRPAFPAAHVGLARVLMDTNEFKQAHAEIDAARRARPAYAEASAVEGRIYREEAFSDEA